ncbi:putative DnaJ domain, Chaperone J-domain superfamily [Helianthus anomalus]
MAKRSGIARRRDDESVPTRAIDSVFRFVQFAEFEILFILFFVIAFIVFKDLLYGKRCNGFVVFAAADYYSTFGVPKSATIKDIKVAYRKLGRLRLSESLQVELDVCGILVICLNL